MSRSVRWVVAVSAAVLSFGRGLWLARSASFVWLPQADADRWVVATAFAAVAAGSVGAATTWWAGQDGSRSGKQVTQRVKASDNSRVNQVGGDQNPAGRGMAADNSPVEQVTQDATASGQAGVTQVGGNQHTSGGRRGRRRRP
ncbi:hypothetical protein OHT93_00535 [Streptomyces sp. NBC_00191]|uniref:hypothetical protein n=1 Tax=Streptomyces sp. NBC_00191 TaxID=2975674 RepID=UPI003251ECEC